MNPRRIQRTHTTHTSPTTPVIVAETILADALLASDALRARGRAGDAARELNYIVRSWLVGRVPPVARTAVRAELDRLATERGLALI